jgi:hypothetical protein
MQRFAFAFLAIVSGAPGALAQTSAQAPSVDAVLACANIRSDAERLACYDKAAATLSPEIAKLNEAREKAAREAAREAAAKAQEEARLAAAKAAADKQAAEQRAAKAQVDAFGASTVAPDKRPAKAQGEEALDTLQATIKEILRGPLGELIVVLDNDQIWRQTEPGTLPVVRVGDQVTLKKRLLSGFFMTLERQRRTIAVRRFR